MHGYVDRRLKHVHRPRTRASARVGMLFEGGMGIVIRCEREKEKGFFVD